MRLLPLWLLLPLLPIDGPPPLARAGRIDTMELREVSGIVRSRSHPGVFWVHNDSGNPPALFAIRADGRLLQRFAVTVPNLDWEDIASDGDGHLIVGDIGNNGALLPLRILYLFDEPDPAEPASMPLKPARVIHYRFPDSGRFDAESLLIDGDQAILVAKYLDGRDAELFTIPLGQPAPLFRPAIARKIGKLPGFTEPATGADLSADGRRLAVCSLDVCRVFERAGPKAAWRLVGGLRYRRDGIEAIAWDGDDLMLASEPGRLYRIRRPQWQARGRSIRRGPAR